MESVKIEAKKNGTARQENNWQPRKGRGVHADFPVFLGKNKGRKGGGETRRECGLLPRKGVRRTAFLNWSFIFRRGE